MPVPRNVYGVTKTAAEDLCELVHRDHGLPCLILRTSRFFPEADDRDDVRAAYDDLNLKVNELLYRRVDLEDVVGAHRLALERAPALGFGRYIISATTPFAPDDLARAARGRAGGRAPPRARATRRSTRERGWRMLPSIERVYVNARARDDLGWSPRHDFRRALARLAAGEDPRSPLALARRREGLPRRRPGPTRHADRPPRGPSRAPTS